MTIKIKDFPHHTTLSEVGQPNPIHWQVLGWNDATQELEAQTPKFKCRDYFNDVVFKINTKKDIQIYGFNTEYIKLVNKEDSLWVAVFNLNPHFVHNVQNVLNVWLWENQHKDPVEVIEESPVILGIPPCFLDNTHDISLVTLLIRICNYNVKFNSFDDIVNYGALQGNDLSIFTKVKQKNVYFKGALEVGNYIWYTNKHYNSEKSLPDYQLSQYVHNSGVHAWQFPQQW